MVPYTRESLSNGDHLEIENGDLKHDTWFRRFTKGKNDPIRKILFSKNSKEDIREDRHQEIENKCKEEITKDGEDLLVKVDGAKKDGKFIFVPLNDNKI